jgi:hypothetical protein
VNTQSGATNSSGWEAVPEESADGVATYSLASWSSFFDFLETEVFHASLASKHSYIWRGQRRSDWSISSSLDRLFEDLNLLTAGPEALEKRSKEHLESFKKAARGRRGPNPAQLGSDNDWWALGQHFGLATPLLDWTRSPFAAAYFAFEEIGSEPTKHRVVYGLDQRAVEQRSHQLSEVTSVEQGRPPVVEFVDPMSDENQRLVSQSGLFTRAPVGAPIERWVAGAFEGSTAPVLLRIRIPDGDRLSSLRTLNRMNINHLSLFPDLAGASRSTNLKLELES